MLNMHRLWFSKIVGKFDLRYLKKRILVVFCAFCGNKGS